MEENEILNKIEMFEDNGQLPPYSAFALSRKCRESEQWMTRLMDAQNYIELLSIAQRIFYVKN